MGRPSEFSQAIADEICERLAKDESLASICREDRMPGLTTVYRWRADNEQFRADYVRARTDQGHTVADVIGDIRKQILSGEVEPDVGRAAADLAKWEASRRASRDYGDKQQVEHSGVVQVDHTARIRAEIDEVLGRSAPLQIEGGDDGE